MPKNTVQSLRNPQNAVLLTIGIILVGVIGFGWFFLFGNFFNLYLILPHRAALSTYLADDLMYNSVLLFSIVGIVLVLILGFNMLKNYDKNPSRYIARLIGRSVLLFITFMVINPRFSVQFAPQLFEFTDMKAEYVTNTKLYFFWIDKLGFDYVGFHKFKTLDDAIQGLEWAKNRKDGLYGYTFDEIEGFGYEEVFKKYDDTEFQRAFLFNLLQDYHNTKMNFLKTYIKDLPKYSKYMSNEKMKKLYNYFYTEYTKLTAQKLPTDKEIEEFGTIENDIRQQF